MRDDLLIDFAAGGPQGRPRARGVYLINQVIKEQKNRLDDLRRVEEMIIQDLTRPWPKGQANSIIILKRWGRVFEGFGGLI